MVSLNLLTSAFPLDQLWPVPAQGVIYLVILLYSHTSFNLGLLRAGDGATVWRGLCGIPVIHALRGCVHLRLQLSEANSCQCPTKVLEM